MYVCVMRLLSLLSFNYIKVRVERDRESALCCRIIMVLLGISRISCMGVRVRIKHFKYI